MIEIAKVIKPHGIHGDLKVRLYSENFDEFSVRGFAHIKEDGSFKRVAYTALRTVPPFIYIHFAGIDTRSDAETLAGTALFLKRNELEPPAQGEYYLFDLIGISVVDENGTVLGQLKDVLQHGAADVYVVSGGRGFMFPALKRVIQSVDIAAGVLRVNAAALQEVAVYDDL